MNIVQVLPVTGLEKSCFRQWVRVAQATFCAALLLVLAGCSSAITKLETWEGSPASAVNSATLEAPGAIQVIEVNGRPMTTYLMDDLALDYSLLPGENELVFTYKTIWAKAEAVENGESKVHVIKSEPQVVRFEAAPNETYRFEFDKPGTRRQAQKMIPQFSATIVGADGQAVAQSSDWSPGDSVAEERTPVPSESSGAASDSEAVSGSAESSLDRMKAVWETASDEEKKAFLRWAFE